ncbi:MAG: toxin-activating lysine-acyltransferase [Amphritea sp.]|nr:toxin-activating lysine-acyltransferase [Amphritea sp.]
MDRQKVIIVSSGMGHSISQTEALGSAVWLWMQSERHSQWSVGELNSRLLPAIMNGQYVLGYENNSPVFFCAWAWFSQEAESRYVEDPNAELGTENWRCGDRFWVTDWLAPYGHSREVVNQLKAHPFFAEQIVRFFGHRGTKSHYMYQFHGRQVSPAENRLFSVSHPVTREFIKEEE